MTPSIFSRIFLIACLLFVTCESTEDNLEEPVISEIQETLELLQEDSPANEVDEDSPETDIEDEEAEEEFVFQPKQCIHEVTGKRPRLTIAEREQTKRIITHVAKRMHADDDFVKLLMLVALRESSYQQGIIHRLNPDLLGSQQAWQHMLKRYEGNPYSQDSSLWLTYGLFGMNSNYFTLLWDSLADPRVLCDPVVDILVYRRAAERALRKLNGPIRCRDSEGELYDFRTKANWANVHRAVNGGKLCPSKYEDRASMMRKYFNTRAARIGLNPERTVTLRMLGKEPEQSLDGEAWATQEEMVMGLWAEIDELEEVSEEI